MIKKLIKSLPVWINLEMSLMNQPLRKNKNQKIVLNKVKKTNDLNLLKFNLINWIYIK